MSELGLRVLLLNARRLPARLLAEEAAILLGVKEHDIPALVNAGILKPLGSGPRNCVKHFHAQEVQDIAGDRKLMERLSRALLRGRNVASTKKVVLHRADVEPSAALASDAPQAKLVPA